MKYRTISTHVPEETAEKLEEKSRKADISLSKYVCHVVQKWIKEGKNIILREGESKNEGND